jgi:co-chaperonin GroES (HSP10)
MSKIRIVAKSITPTKDNVLVTEMNFGERKSRFGIIIPGDDGVERGIRPRWGKVMAVGPTQTDVNVGEWVLIAHGRWTRGIDVTNKDTDETITVRMVDPRDILGATTEQPTDDEVRTVRYDQGQK